MTLTPKQERNQVASEPTPNAAQQSAGLVAAVWPDPDPGWRVRTGVGLVIHAPMSDERREAIRRESEREAQAAELDAQQARDAAYEKRWMLERQGVVPVSVADRLAAASFGMDRADKVEERREREAAELLGKSSRPLSTALLREAKAEREARKAEAEATPASKAKLGRIAASLARLKEGVYAISGHKIPL